MLGGMLAVPATVFEIVATTYMFCTLILAMRNTNASGSSSPVILLEVTAEDFWRLLKFCAPATIVFSFLLIFPTQLTKLIPLTLNINTPRWVRSFVGTLSNATHALEIIVFPAILFIVLESSEWKAALWQTKDLWRRRARDWFALLLPALVLAFAINLLVRLLPWLTGCHTSGGLSGTFAHYVDAIVKPLWLGVIVRWWDWNHTQSSPLISCG